MKGGYMDRYDKEAMVFKAFCDGNRLRILEQLQTGEKCACKLMEELDIARSTLAHHMDILTESGIVKGRKEGKWIHYSLNEEGTKYARDLLVNITAILYYVEK